MIFVLYIIFISHSWSWCDFMDMVCSQRNLFLEVSNEQENVGYW